MDNKHYIRLDGTNITKGFSDAFETPQESDVCINDNGGRHFEIDGKVNPNLIDDGIHLYKYVDGQIVAKTDVEIQSEKDAMIPPIMPPTESERIEALESAISVLMGV